MMACLSAMGIFYISWIDYKGKRQRRKTNARNMAELRDARAAEPFKVGQARIYAILKPTKDSFEMKAKEYLHRSVCVTKIKPLS